MSQVTTPAVGASFSDVAPKFADLTRGLLFGDIWERPQLCKRDRHVVVVAALVALYRPEQMPFYFKRALEHGVTQTELVEIITHLSFYVGWPAAVSAVNRVGEAVKAFTDGGSAVLEPYEPKALPAPVHGSKSTVGDIAPKLAELTLDVLFADIWERAELSHRDRSLVTVTALIVTGGLEQMAFHMRRALDNGLTGEELVEVVTHLAFYAGWPKSMSAINRVRTAIQEYEAARAA